MLFFNTRSSDILQRAQRAAVAAHRPAALRALLVSHGDRAFAKSLSGLSGRVIEDALTMLAVGESARIVRHLPYIARKRLHDIDDGNTRQSHVTHPPRSLPSSTMTSSAPCAKSPSGIGML